MGAMKEAMESVEKEAASAREERARMQELAAAQRVLVIQSTREGGEQEGVGGGERGGQSGQLERMGERLKRQHALYESVRW